MRLGKVRKDSFCCGVASSAFHKPGGIIILVTLIAFNIVFAVEKVEPPDLIVARNNYSKEFVYKVKPLQRKYRQALEKYKTAFIRSDDLDSATEADKEIQSVFEWTNISVKKGQRVMKNQQLNSLLQNFEKAVDKEVIPINSRYKNKLERLKKSYTNSENLNAALFLDKELKKITNSLPVEAGRIEYFSGLNKPEFEDWLERQSFDFSGVFAGFTKLKFKDGVMSYLPGDKERQYKYRIATSRSLEINDGHRNGGWTIEFARNLQSGNFQTNKNTYPIRINARQTPGGIPDNAKD